MVVSDYFTKWTEAYTIPNQEAETVTKKLVDEFVCHFGGSEILHTDQGRNFESKLVHEMCVLLGVRKTRTTPYHPQSYGQVERFNRTQTSMLSNYVAEKRRDWDAHLSKVLMAYRSSEHETTKCTPYFMFGREVRLRVDIMFGRCPEEPGVNLRNALEQANDYYDVRVFEEPYVAGDRVWLDVPAVKKGQTSKFATSCDGPYEVLAPLSDVTYRVRKEGPGGKISVEHCNRLKPCKTPPNRIADQDHPHVHHPPINEDPLNNEPVVQRYARDATDLLYGEDDLWGPEDAHVPPVSSTADEEPPISNSLRREVRHLAWVRNFVLENSL